MKRVRMAAMSIALAIVATSAHGQTEDGNVYKIGGGVSAPTATYTPQPQLSEQARAAKVGGSVLVALVVDKNGLPQKVHVIRGVGMGLDEKALEAVRQYKFRPALKDGVPVPVQLNIMVQFQVVDPPPASTPITPLSAVRGTPGDGTAQITETKTAPVTSSTQSATAAVQATPAMWMVKGTKGTIYLFGTVHVMKPDVHWETPKVQDAFKQSGTLYLEIADVGPDTAAAMLPLVQSMGLDPDHSLSTKISKEDIAALDGMLKTSHLPGEAQFEPMQPWLVYITLSILPAIQAGYDPASGIDSVLQKEATAAGKPVKGFETAAEQLHFLADFPQAQQVAMLHETIAELPQSVQRMNEMVADWEKGDVEKIADMENDDLKGKQPELYKKLLVDRNVAIADSIITLLKDPSSGAIFIAVGAAHLAGPDSILKDLERHGFTASRVQ